MHRDIKVGRFRSSRAYLLSLRSGAPTAHIMRRPPFPHRPRHYNGPPCAPSTPPTELSPPAAGTPPAVGDADGDTSPPPLFCTVPTSPLRAVPESLSPFAPITISPHLPSSFNLRSRAREPAAARQALPAQRQARRLWTQRGHGERRAARAVVADRAAPGGCAGGARGATAGIARRALDGVDIDVGLAGVGDAIALVGAPGAPLAARLVVARDATTHYHGRVSRSPRRANRSQLLPSRDGAGVCRRSPCSLARAQGAIASRRLARSGCYAVARALRFSSISLSLPPPARPPVPWRPKALSITGRPRSDGCRTAIRFPR